MPVPSSPPLTIALVHVLFNLFAVVLICGVPFLRELPIKAAEALARVGSENKLLALGYVAGLFFALPALMMVAVSGKSPRPGHQLPRCLPVRSHPPGIPSPSPPGWDKMPLHLHSDFKEQENPMKFILIALLIAGAAYYFYSSSNNRKLAEENVRKGPSSSPATRKNPW